MNAPAASSDDPRECVVLLHGVALANWAMRPLATAIERAGYRAVNLSYPSRARTIEQLAREFLPAQLRAHAVERAPRVHFVAHSMGCLVVRNFLQHSRPPTLGRVVMLGPPNHGSAAADRARRHTVLRWIMGINLSRLGTGRESIIPALPAAADYELGIIAGTSRINPLFDHALAGPHDGVVTVDSARLPGARDFLVLPHSHTIMLWRTRVIAQVVHFLREGKFQR